MGKKVADSLVWLTRLSCTLVKYISLIKGARKLLLIINLINKFLIINLSPNLLNKLKKGEL